MTFGDGSASTAVRGHYSSRLPWCPTRAQPTPRNQRKEFWIAGQRDVLTHKCSPWDFYELYASGESDVSLVLCNKRTEVRVMTIYNTIGKGVLPQMRHRNIIDIYEVYCFKGQIFIISEYLDFSLEDLLRHDIHLTETEIACVIGQILEGIRFIRSSKLQHLLITVESIRVSQRGKVKIDPTIDPAGSAQTSADLNSLGTIMSQLMREDKEALKLPGRGGWSAEALNFLEATCSASPDELSDHKFVAGSNRPKALTALCFMSNIMVERRLCSKQALET